MKRLQRQGLVVALAVDVTAESTEVFTHNFRCFTRWSGVGAFGGFCQACCATV